MTKPPTTPSASPEDDSEESLSDSSQVGRDQLGGSHVSGHEPGTKTKEGWPMPDQSDIPPEWPEATVD